jgi:acetolactate synthase-1/2/3 large subunit
MPTVARAIVDTLLAQGITHGFGVPGESYLPLIDALLDVQDRFTLVTCRHEATAAHMAEAQGKLTGQPGVCLVTRGPGATHAAIGVHTASHDSTPMLLLVGQVERAMLGRSAFQEVDYEAMFAPLAKKVLTLREANRAPEIAAAAVAHAMSGRPGPVVLVLPEDVLPEEAPPAVATPFLPPLPAPEPAAIARLSELLAQARRPVLWLGGPGWTPRASAEIAEAAQRLRIPVVTAWRRKDLIDNAHPCFAGEMGLGANPALVERVRQADLVVSIGARLTEVQTHGYTLPAPPVPAQAWVMIHPDPEVLAGVYRPALAIQAHVRFAASALLELAHVAHGQAEAGWAGEARALYETWSRPTTVADGVNMAEVIAHMTASLPEDAIVTNGAGNFSAWVHRFHQHRRLGTQLAPTSGAMGYGFPAGLAAKLLHPGREVVTVAGDGDFLMSAHELATAVRYGINLVTLVVDNGQYGTIAMHQARDFPGRRNMVDMTNPDWAAMAQSYGAFGANVTETAAFPEAFAAARASGRPAIIALRTDRREIAPGIRLPD